MTALDLAALIVLAEHLLVALWVWLGHRQRTGAAVKRALARQAGAK